jgi:mono/diheme cytochrome c family protein
MRLLLRILAFLVLLVVLAAAGGLTYLYAKYPDVPAPSAAFKIESTPERVARGEYLANHVAICMDCHTPRDFTKFAGPIRHDQLGAGGDKFDNFIAGVPGTLYAKNITPAGIAGWTDGELLRAVTEGVSKDGTALFPLMPYPNYGQIAEDDVMAILAYVRSLAPVESHIPERSLDVPMNVIVRTIPGAAQFGTRPSPSDKVAYGQYLVRVASCADCHTQIDNRGQPLPGMAFAGGNQFRDPDNGYRVRSANITPNADTGIGTWTEEQFINKFKAFEAPDDRVLTDAERRQNTAMHWRMYAGMTREDLGAIYAYLRTLKPVTHRVDKWPDAQATR